MFRAGRLWREHLADKGSTGSGAGSRHGDRDLDEGQVGKKGGTDGGIGKRGETMGSIARGKNEGQTGCGMRDSDGDQEGTGGNGDEVMGRDRVERWKTMGGQGWGTDGDKDRGQMGDRDGDKWGHRG